MKNTKSSEWYGLIGFLFLTIGLILSGTPIAAYIAYLKFGSFPGPLWNADPLSFIDGFMQYSTISGIILYSLYTLRNGGGSFVRLRFESDSKEQEIEANSLPITKFFLVILLRLILTPIHIWFHLIFPIKKKE